MLLKTILILCLASATRQMQMNNFRSGRSPIYTRRSLTRSMMNRRRPLIWPQAQLTPAPKISEVITEDIQKSIVDAHNRWRAEVQPEATNMLKMKYDKELEGLARIHANTCLYGHIKHSGTTKYRMHGENIYFSINRLTGKENIERAIMLWGEEYKDYNYFTRKCKPGKKCGHYTQIVWHSSYAVGCAIKLCPVLRRERSTSTYRNAKYVVCNYGPAGNWIGRFPYTRGPSMSQCPAGQVCVGKGADVTTTTPAATNQTTAANENSIDVEQVRLNNTKDLEKKTEDLVSNLNDLPKKTDKKKVLEEDKKLLRMIKSTVTKLESLLKKIDFEYI